MLHRPLDQIPWIECAQLAELTSCGQQRQKKAEKEKPGPPKMGARSSSG